MTTAEKTKEIKKSPKQAPPPVRHAIHADELTRLKRIKGQVEGLENMILDGRYCPDILVQVKAVISALKSVELTILERHIRHCLSNAIANGNKKETDKKIEEIILLLGRRSHN